MCGLITPRTAGLEIFDDLLARGVDGQAMMYLAGAGAQIFMAVVVDDREDRQVRALRCRVIVLVVRRRHLDRAGAERAIDERVGDDRNLAPDERQLDHLADEVRVALVVGMNRDRGVAEHRLGPRGRDDNLAAADHGILDLPQRAGFLDDIDLEVRHHRLARRIPVDHPLGAEDQALFVQPHERLGDGAVGLVVHREALARPIEREAHQLLLLADAIALGLAPRPRAAQEFLAAEIAVPVLAALP